MLSFNVKRIEMIDVNTIKRDDLFGDYYNIFAGTRVVLLGVFDLCFKPLEICLPHQLYTKKIDSIKKQYPGCQVVALPIIYTWDHAINLCAPAYATETFAVKDGPFQTITYEKITDINKPTVYVEGNCYKFNSEIKKLFTSQTN
jgi:hypothetical protein